MATKPPTSNTLGILKVIQNPQRPPGLDGMVLMVLEDINSATSKNANQCSGPCMTLDDLGIPPAVFFLRFSMSNIQESSRSCYTSMAETLSGTLVDFDLTWAEMEIHMTWALGIVDQKSPNGHFHRGG